MSIVVITTKVIFNIWQCFSYLLDEVIARICKIIDSHDGFLRIEQKLLLDGLYWLSYYAGSSKNHPKISFSKILLQSLESLFIYHQTNHGLLLIFPPKLFDLPPVLRISSQSWVIILSKYLAYCKSWAIKKWAENIAANHEAAAISAL